MFIEIRDLRDLDHPKEKDYQACRPRYALDMARNGTINASTYNKSRAKDFTEDQFYLALSRISGKKVTKVRLAKVD